jgi:hypothetical protein
LGIFIHQIEPIPEHCRPLSGGCLSERLERFRRGGNGFLRIFGIEFRTCSNELASGGIVDLEGRPG